jgi:hypothetical protein
MKYASVLVSWGKSKPPWGRMADRVGGRLLTQGFPPGKAGEVLGGWAGAVKPSGMHGRTAPATTLKY